MKKSRSLNQTILQFSNWKQKVPRKTSCFQQRFPGQNGRLLRDSPFLFSLLCAELCCVL